ncbi:MAG: nucleoside triphosphate pyrophosphohydrolase [Candidatus Binatia bacterium]
MSDAFHRLVEVMHRLRRECPWDREQTSRSILPYLIEETYEVLEAIEDGDPAEVRAELGDLLLQVLFHSELAKERGEFDVWDVAETITEKMIRRHPHVFAGADVANADAVLAQWSRIKRAERTAEAGEASVLDGAPRSLPALLRAERLGEKASRVGFDWPSAAAVLDKVREELAELDAAIAEGKPERVEAELGDLLFALASFGRRAGTSAELALGRALQRFEGRFRAVERAVAASGRDIHDLTPEDLEAHWQQVKLTEL